MENIEKMYYIKVTHAELPANRHPFDIHQGTFEYLSKNVFGLILEIAHRKSARIPLKPKTITSLVRALNRSAKVGIFKKDAYELSTEQEFAECENTPEYRWCAQHMWAKPSHL